MADVPNSTPPCVTVAMLAKQWQCSMSFIYDEIKAGRLMAMRFGPKLLRIRKTDVEAYEAAALIIANEPVVGIPTTPRPAEPSANKVTAEQSARMREAIKDMRRTNRIRNPRG